MTRTRFSLIGTLFVVGLFVSPTGGVGEATAVSLGLQDQDPDVVRRAEEALRRGDAEGARTLLESARAGGRDDPRLLFYLGRAYLELGRPDDALEVLQQAEGVGPGAPVSVVFWTGVALTRSGRLADASERFRRVLRLDPGSEAARLQLGWVYLLQERAPEAVEQLEGLVRDAPDHALGWYYLGLARHQGGELEGAEEAYARAVEIDRALADAWLALGRVRLEAGRPEDARPALESALELAPDAAAARFELGRLALREGRLPEAIRWLEQAVALDPAHAPARYQLALAYGRAGRVEESQAMFAAHAALDASSRQAERRALGALASGTTYERALEALAAGRPAEAVAAFRAVIRELGEEAGTGAWLGLGAACLELADPGCALEALERLAELDPELAVGHLLRAQALEELGRGKEAAEARSRYRELVEGG